MTIVSGDSRGKTSFWNGKQGTVIKVKTSHSVYLYLSAVCNTLTIQGSNRIHTYDCKPEKSVTGFIHMTVSLKSQQQDSYI